MTWVYLLSILAAANVILLCMIRRDIRKLRKLHLDLTTRLTSFRLEVANEQDLFYEAKQSMEKMLNRRPQ